MNELQITHEQVIKLVKIADKHVMPFGEEMQGVSYDGIIEVLTTYEKMKAENKTPKLF